jgi:hypothetical protein
MDIIETLTVGQDVFLRNKRWVPSDPAGYSFPVCVWGKVVEISPTEVTVETDPSYGATLITFDKDRNSIRNNYGGTMPWRLYRNPQEAGIVMRDGKYLPGID